MFSLANMFYFLAHEFARLRGWRFAFSRIFARPLDCFPFWHGTKITQQRRFLDVHV